MLVLLASAPSQLAGCASTMGGLSLEEVSDTPIAFVYWDPESARRRQEVIDDVRSGRSSASPRRIGVATADGIAALFGRDPASAEGLGRFPGHIVLLNPRTGELSRFEGSPANARPLAWSPDHERLLFTSAHIGDEFQIYEYDLADGELRTVSSGPAMHLEADYASDGRLVMSFIEHRGTVNTAGLTVTDEHGANPQPVVDGVYPSGPRFSPDGQLVVYVRAVNRAPRTVQARDRSTIIAQPPALGAEVSVLARGREPAFLPDGSGLVYTAETSDGWRLHRMRIEGGGRARVGGSIREERSPAVSPDGRHVVYVSPGDDGIERLYIRRIDGSGDRILLGEGAAAWPVW
jgi:Tol biopolymer transport system component